MVDELPEIKSALAIGRIGLWTWHAEREQLKSDSQTSGFFGFESKDYTGPADPFLERILPEDKLRFKAIAANSIRAMIPFTAEFEVLWPDKSVHFLSVRGQAESHSHGNLVSFAGICREIGDQRLQYEVEKKLAIFEERDDFIAALAHDLRVPLVGSERILSMLISGQLGVMDPAHIDLLKKIKTSEHASLLMINNLLDVYRLEAGGEAFAFGPVNIGALINRCCEDIAIVAASKTITIEKHIEADQPAVQADVLAIQRVVDNLLSNAIKFSAPSSIIKVTLTHCDSRAKLMIEDHGPGIAPDQLDKVFSRFRHASRVNRPIGTGLGLYLCRKIIQAHHGEIKCESVVTEGSTFLVELPHVSKGRARILIADDNADMRALLARYLKPHGVEIDFASGGYEAVQASYDVSYDAIFLDLQMPDLDGYNAALAIRKNGSRVPIIAFTAYGDSPEKLSEAGLTATLEKPIDDNVLLKLLKRYVFSK